MTQIKTILAASDFSVGGTWAAYRAALLAQEMVPIDFSVHCIAALKFAVDFAPVADFLLFHPYPVASQPELALADMPDDVAKRFDDQQHEQALSNMESLRYRTSSPLTRTTFLVEPGQQPKDLVASKAAVLNSDLVVLGKHGHSFPGEFFLGGVTRRTLNKVACDVAIVPEHFPL